MFALNNIFCRYTSECKDVEFTSYNRFIKMSRRRVLPKLAAVLMLMALVLLGMARVEASANPRSSTNEADESLKPRDPSGAGKNNGGSSSANPKPTSSSNNNFGLVSKDKDVKDSPTSPGTMNGRSGSGGGSSDARLSVAVDRPPNNSASGGASSNRNQNS